MLSFNIPDYSLVKRVNGTKQGSDYLRNLVFSKQDGTKLTEKDLETEKDYGPEFLLEDSEEIIGIYGYMQLVGVYGWKSDYCFH